MGLESNGPNTFCVNRFWGLLALSFQVESKIYYVPLKLSHSNFNLVISKPYRTYTNGKFGFENLRLNTLRRVVDHFNSISIQSFVTMKDYSIHVFVLFPVMHLSVYHTDSIDININKIQVLNAQWAEWWLCSRSDLTQPRVRHDRMTLFPITLK